MQYPTLEEVESASRIQLARWCRFLSSPRRNKINSGSREFYCALNLESAIMRKISKRFQEMGGFTPEISKEIGWKE